MGLQQWTGSLGLWDSQGGVSFHRGAGLRRCPPVSMSPSVAGRMCLLNSGTFFVLRFLDSALNLFVLFLRATLECQGCPPKALSGWEQLPQRAHPFNMGGF